MYFSEQKVEQFFFYNRFHKTTNHSNTCLKHDCVTKNKNRMFFNQQITPEFCQMTKYNK